ncbi:hypothetical protein KC218_27650, partial [Mycobacterium tuberculosis]|nr:hypothetical protein [Mycobacterium tuberculosis]
TRSAVSRSGSCWTIRALNGVDVDYLVRHTWHLDATRSPRNTGGSTKSVWKVGCSGKAIEPEL